jgi:hypothetical protein
MLQVQQTKKDRERVKGEKKKKGTTQRGAEGELVQRQRESWAEKRKKKKKKEERRRRGGEGEQRKKKKNPKKQTGRNTPENSLKRPKHPEILPKVEWGVVSYRFAYRYEIFRPFRLERKTEYTTIGLLPHSTAN